MLIFGAPVEQYLPPYLPYLRNYARLFGEVLGYSPGPGSLPAGLLGLKLKKAPELPR